ncbi:uncharacterized protein BO88DRAFT_187052 [Aspergillus vadensis CBS 113365]|uniref:Uncharacterized protein n=1 Tax=Aspergillus vadensis (strain CBS 113365 / IMI 142717 / IBT 24658) TaxID=1448311 RepID=A0A319AXC8_ASPVC|nr:hypothetical protein BO88DRAFT_187052 [Aspergillus vadensis CBS 113365]PYH64051.1 hypothetical protein BO88DRAFT_187052 [Aspergillus vadensis CBS 113365]
MRSHGTSTRLNDRYDPTRTFLANPGTINWTPPGLSQSHIRGSPETLVHVCCAIAASILVLESIMPHGLFSIPQRKIIVPQRVSSRTSGRLLWYDNNTVVVLSPSRNMYRNPGWCTYFTPSFPGAT